MFIDGTRQPMRKLIDLGWANGWKEEPEIVKKCRQLGHELQEINMSTTYRQADYERRCDICSYVSHVDMSD
jgi:hypothetical protein